MDGRSTQHKRLKMLEGNWETQVERRIKLWVCIHVCICMCVTYWSIAWNTGKLITELFDLNPRRKSLLAYSLYTYVHMQPPPQLLTPKGKHKMQRPLVAKWHLVLNYKLDFSVPALLWILAWVSFALAFFSLNIYNPLSSPPRKQVSSEQAKKGCGFHCLTKLELQMQSFL